MDTPPALQLIDFQIDALFVCDADRRIKYIREPGYEESELEPGPRFFMGRTLQGNVWRVRHGLPDGLVGELEALARAEPIAENLAHPPQTAAAIQVTLHTHAPITHEERGPAYWIPDTVPAPPVAVLISEVNAHVLDANFAWTRRSRSGLKTGPLAAAVVQDSAVSICFCARLTGEAAEAGVESVEAFRGQGYASAAVARWAFAIRERGLIPLYSTSWQNVASQGVARKLGMVQYADDWSIS